MKTEKSFSVLSGSFSLRYEIKTIRSSSSPTAVHEELLLNLNTVLIDRTLLKVHDWIHRSLCSDQPALPAFRAIRSPVRWQTDIGVSSCSQKRDRHRLSRFPSEYVAYSIPTSLLHWRQYCSAICTVFIAVSPPALFLLLILCRIFRKKNRAALFLSHSNTAFLSIRLQEKVSSVLCIFQDEKANALHIMIWRDCYGRHFIAYFFIFRFPFSYSAKRESRRGDRTFKARGVLSGNKGFANQNSGASKLL